MSTSEYHELFLKCQETGIYHVFTFDIVNSKNMSIETRRNAQPKLISLMLKIYEEIQNIEKKTNKKILVFEDDFYTTFNPIRRGFGLKQEPFIIGDMFGFTVYRDSISTETIYYLYEKYKEELGIDFDFHLANGYYETNDYAEGGTKYFRGYCIDVLSNFHKEQLQKELESVKIKLKRRGELHD